MTNDPKTSASTATVAIGDDVTAALVDHRRRQEAERREWGPGWTDNGYVFVREDGQPYHPQRLTRMFARAVAQADVPVGQIVEVGAAALGGRPWRGVADPRVAAVLEELVRPDGGQRPRRLHRRGQWASPPRRVRRRPARLAPRRAGGPGAAAGRAPPPAGRTGRALSRSPCGRWISRHGGDGTWAEFSHRCGGRVVTRVRHPPPRDHLPRGRAGRRQRAGGAAMVSGLEPHGSGKPVRIRRGPATVTGERTSTTPLGPRAREGEGSGDPGARRPTVSTAWASAHSTRMESTWHRSPRCSRAVPSSAGVTS